MIQNLDYFKLQTSCRILFASITFLHYTVLIGHIYYICVNVVLVLTQTCGHLLGLHSTIFSVQSKCCNIQYINLHPLLQCYP
jgi:hypothetical protein